MIQAQLEFKTASPINIEKFKGQVKTIYTHLDTIGSITVYDAISKYGIFHLHSRISDLRNKCGITIYDKTIVRNGTTCKEYSLKKICSLDIR